jgi:hypothetical protein
LQKPKILIASPLKNEAFWIQKHLQTWEKVDYPRDRIRWIILLGRSIDKTEEILLRYFKKHKWNVEIYPEPKFHNPTSNALFIADAMNEFKKYYQDEDFAVLDDGDVIKIPKTFLEETTNLNLDIVAPGIWIENTNPPQFFDTYVFRTLDGFKFPPFNIPYKNSKLPIEIGSVGTLVVVKGKIFKEIAFENPAPTLQFCKNVRKAGYKIWFAPWIKVTHANTMEKGEYHMPLEFYVQRGIIPRKMLEKVR